MIEPDLMEANVDTYDEGAILGAPKNWQPLQPPSAFKQYDSVGNNQQSWKVDSVHLSTKLFEGDISGPFATVVPANENG